MEACEVLIIGAGPTGLTLANALGRLGVSCRLLDLATERSDRSKALGIQAGTLECLLQLFGEKMVEEMIRSGCPARFATLDLGAREEIRVSMESIPSRFPYILILEQSETERILEERLSRTQVSVERQMEFLDFSEAKGGLVARIQDSSGTITSVETRFLVGCDGAHSAVRRAAGIGYAGASYNGDFVLADAQISWPWEYGGVRTIVSERGALACFPMRGERRYRLILFSGEETKGVKAEIDQAELQRRVDAIARAKIQVESTSWLTRFRVHHRLAERFRRGNVFLAGDAAHIHSPVGGQGMNLGIQDALNLADKLAAVIRKGHATGLLDEYETERMRVAKKVVRGTDVFSRAALSHRLPFISLLRRTLVAALARQAQVQARAVRVISQIDEARRDMATRKCIGR